MRVVCHCDVMRFIHHLRMHERHKTILDLYRDADCDVMKIS
jgi:hypothetical protein